MILVDVYVLFMNHLYDFKLDENVPVADITEELKDMLLSAEKFQEEDVTLLLCDRERGQALLPNLTLKQNGVSSGSSLILI